MKNGMTAKELFGTDKRIKLGIWGLGRGKHFYKCCESLGLDVTAGCDFNDIMLDKFKEEQPQAKAFSDAKEFLKSDIDAVVLATFCPDHAGQAIQCLEAGKHVLSEVTAFHTPAEGVRLLEAVETSGLVYNLAENYPYMKNNMYLAQKWKEGLLGDLLYAETEYNHDSRRPLSFRYLSGEPVEPGWTLHSWRSWKHQHFYCTHSLGPVMRITGSRPTRVVSLPGKNSMAANVSQVKASGIATVAPSLITMDNGGLVRNFMGSTPGQTHHEMRIFGSRGAAFHKGGSFFMSLGAKGNCETIELDPKWPYLGKEAEKMGHGGGDFWVLYNFARAILAGEPAFWNVYKACEVTLPGIFAYRSAVNNGQAYDIPDFSKKKDRDKFRNDDEAQGRYDFKNGLFPEGADKAKLKHFTAIMTDLIEKHATGARAVIDWLSVIDDVKDKHKVLKVTDSFIAECDNMKHTFRLAQEIIDLYPDSDGAQMLREMLQVADVEIVTQDWFVEKVKLVEACMKT